MSRRIKQLVFFGTDIIDNKNITVTHTQYTRISFDMSATMKGEARALEGDVRGPLIAFTFSG